MIKYPAFVISVAIMKVVIQRVCQLAVWNLLLVLFLKIVSSTEWILQALHGTMILEIIRRFRQNIFYQRANIYNEKNIYQAKKNVYR
jgi:hypothetical protein